MTTNKPNLDFVREEEKARSMSDRELWGALLDIQKTLPCSDGLDRQDGGTRGGFYRDQASVYRTELKRRSEGGAR